MLFANRLADVRDWFISGLLSNGYDDNDDEDEDDNYNPHTLEQNSLQSRASLPLLYPGA